MGVRNGRRHHDARYDPAGRPRRARTNSVHPRGGYPPVDPPAKGGGPPFTPLPRGTGTDRPPPGPPVSRAGASPRGGLPPVSGAAVPAVRGDPRVRERDRDGAPAACPPPAA